MTTEELEYDHKLHLRRYRDHLIQLNAERRRLVEERDKVIAHLNDVIDGRVEILETPLLCGDTERVERH